MKDNLTIIIFGAENPSPSETEEDKRFEVLLVKALGWVRNPSDLSVRTVYDEGRGLQGNNRHLAVPNLANYEGIGIGMNKGYTVNVKRSTLIFGLPCLNPCVAAFDGDITLWNCSHHIAQSIFSANNMSDVNKTPDAYHSKYLSYPPRNERGTIDRGAKHYVDNDVVKFFRPLSDINFRKAAKSVKERQQENSWWDTLKNASSIFFSKNKGIS